jgi:hypothetical protein
MIELTHINPIFRQSIDYIDHDDPKTCNVINRKNTYATMVGYSLFICNKSMSN